VPCSTAFSGSIITDIKINLSFVIGSIVAIYVLVGIQLFINTLRKIVFRGFVPAISIGMFSRLVFTTTGSPLLEMRATSAIAMTKMVTEIRKDLLFII
jgi:hypothetical protein